MRNKLFLMSLVGFVLLFLAGVSAAQGQVQHRGLGPQGAQAAVEKDIVTLTGTVTAANLAPGQGMPSVTLQDAALGAVTVYLGPYRTLADSKFEIKTGQVLQVKAFADPRTAGAYAAIELRDGSGAVAVLRNAAGMPLRGGWARGLQGAMGRGMMRGAGPARAMAGGPGTGDCAICTRLDLKAGRTFAGIVQNVEMGPGQGLPNFTLLADGKATVIVASPFWVLQQADFTVSVGDSLAVFAYPSLQQEGYYVAAEIVNAGTKQSVKLRDENGIPLGSRGRGLMRGIRR